MKISKYSQIKDGQIKASSIVGGGGSSSSTTIEGGSRAELDRTIWGKVDTGDDIDGSMTVNGDINIKVINYNWEPDDDDEEGDDVEYEEGGGNLNVELDVTIGRHLYVNHSHEKHDGEKVCLIEEVETNTKDIKTNADNIKKNADNIEINKTNIETNKQNIASNLSEINSLKTRVTNNETAIQSLDENMQMAETSIRNNAEEIAKLQNRTTANETAIANFLPIGSIIMFSGTMAEIPEGWAICNGENGTPNLIGKFIKAWTQSGQTGGSNSVMLSSSNLPELKLHVDNTKIADNQEWQERLNKYVPTLDKIEEGVYDEGGSSHYALYTGKKKGDNGLLGVKYTAILNDVEDYMYVGEKNNTQTALTIEPEYYALIYICKIA